MSSICSEKVNGLIQQLLDDKNKALAIFQVLHRAHRSFRTLPAGKQAPLLSPEASGAKPSHLPLLSVTLLFNLSTLLFSDIKWVEG